MEKHRLNTGLDNFALLKGISMINERQINAWTQFEDAPAFLAMEALAQLGATHARYLCGFESHAFLMKMNSFKLSGNTTVSGKFELSGKLAARTQSAFTHDLTARLNGRIIFSGRFSFALADYDQTFDKKTLKTHYKRVFSCLTASKTE